MINLYYTVIIQTMWIFILNILPYGITKDECKTITVNYHYICGLFCLIQIHFIFLRAIPPKIKTPISVDIFPPVQWLHTQLLCLRSGWVELQDYCECWMRSVKIWTNQFVWVIIFFVFFQAGHIHIDENFFYILITFPNPPFFISLISHQ